MRSTDSLQQCVCVNCKLRKKKCDRAKPRCSYCSQKRLNCQYKLPDTGQLPVQPSIALNVATDPIIRSSLLLSNTLSEVLLSHPTNVESTLYLRVLSIIRTTGQHIDDIITRYFRGIHTFIPMLSRSRVNRYLDDHGAPPPAAFSILLLSMCLITYHPDLVPPSAHSLDQETLYVTTKTFFGLVQASFQPSLQLIQATMIMATYEYANGKIHDAFASIGLCARMGYAAHIDSAHPSREMEDEEYSENEEKANTWWNVLICERTFLCETDLKQPLSTKMPRNTTSHRHDGTPRERLRSTSKSETDDINAGGFACVMQATYLLDQVVRALDMADFESRYNQLHGLDHALQTVLAVIMDQSQGRGGIYCTAIIILLRAIIIIHSHNLTYLTTESNLNPESILKEKGKRLESSHAAMKTITTMVHEISTTHTSVLSLVDTIPPSFVYVIREMLRYIQNAEYRVDEWNDVEKRLSSAPRKFEYRWGGRQIYT